MPPLPRVVSHTGSTLPPLLSLFPWTSSLPTLVGHATHVLSRSPAKWGGEKRVIKAWIDAGLHPRLVWGALVESPPSKSRHAWNTFSGPGARSTREWLSHAAVTCTPVAGMPSPKLTRDGPTGHENGARRSARALAASRRYAARPASHARCSQVSHVFEVNAHPPAEYRAQWGPRQRTRAQAALDSCMALTCSFPSSWAVWELQAHHKGPHGSLDIT